MLAFSKFVPVEAKKKSKQIVAGNNSPVIVSNNLIKDFSASWRHYIGTDKRTSVFVLIDENVQSSASKLIKSIISLPFIDSNVEVLCGGEEIKSIQGVLKFWDKLSSLEVDRTWVLLAIGGGTITDLAGFIASTYKRGLRTVYLPTTLMAMVDASIGGKNAVNQKKIKNQIGTFYLPKFVFVYPAFLESLPKKELHSGYAELFKYAMLSKSDSLLNKLKKTGIDILPSDKILLESIRIKQRIVRKDPKEKNLRISLNLGHTMGHAFESCFYKKNESITHGQAVAWGMQFAIYVSKQKGYISDKIAVSFSDLLFEHYKKPVNIAFADLRTYLKQDKKNANGMIRMVLPMGFARYKFEDIDIEDLSDLDKGFLEQ